jgi:hypothetical protein
MIGPLIDPLLKTREDCMAEDWIIVKVVGSEEEASVVLGFLESCGIDAEIESLYSSEFPAEVGDLSEVRIRVPADRAGEATALLNERENVATGEDGALAGAALDEAADGEGPVEP